MGRCLFYLINSPWVWCQWSQYLWKRDAPYQPPVPPILPFLKWTGLHCLGHFMGWDLSLKKWPRLKYIIFKHFTFCYSPSLSDLGVLYSKERESSMERRQVGIQCGAGKVRRIIQKVSILLTWINFLQKSYLAPQVCFFFPLQTMLCLRIVYGNPMDYSPPGSSVHGILQARILE